MSLVTTPSVLRPGAGAAMKRKAKRRWTRYLHVLQDILSSPELFERCRALLWQLMIFVLACLLLVVVLVIWRAGEISRIVEAL